MEPRSNAKDFRNSPSRWSCFWGELVTKLPRPSDIKGLEARAGSCVMFKPGMRCCSPLQVSHNPSPPAEFLQSPLRG